MEKIELNEKIEEMINQKDEGENNKLKKKVKKNLI